MNADAIQTEFNRQLAESASIKQELAARQAGVMAEMAAVMVSAFRQGKRVYWCGNGGSFTDCHHIVGELVGRYGYDRPPLPSFVLAAGVASLTAIANDYGYEQIFKREAEAVLQKGDVLVGLSTSGNSKNVIAALEVARARGCVTLGWAGQKTARIDEVCDLVLHVPSSHTPRIQECHIAVGHVICDIIEKSLFPRA
ncbi:MAG: SIS domain-containing protein [Planctomycetaceae bacterium]|nr:Phosphoheptose isomerase [Planctomycetota bacterium]MCQ3948836.1 phosphoheptose isomerase [Planctomycetota bacterium]NUO15304.1 SIS domain-containing protein [Planctomycetaceae bacterium]GIK51555.1 MAG: phosphoheptose isomerase [Planctomycetota bacterium]HRJ77337.1 SIS domain-containing protein [Planctomycetota bacterium]